MYYLLSLFSGALTALMIVSNGKLSAATGLNSATLLIHITGLLTISFILLLKRENPFAKRNRIFLYLGGVIGVATTVMNNLVFGQISLSAIVALGLLGQSLTSIIIDQFGLFQRPKNPLQKKQFFGLFIIFAGILSMVKDFRPLPVILSVVIGFTLVISRIFNARLSLETSTYTSTFFNYFTGLLCASPVFLLFGRSESFYLHPVLPQNPFYYLGAVLSVVVVFLASFIINKISTLFSTLFMFIGQLFFGMVLDILLSHSFQKETLFGGLLVSIGLFFYLLYAKDNKQISRESSL